MRFTLAALAFASALATSIASPSIAEENCTRILSDLSFCPDEVWTEDTEEHPYGIAVWHKDDVTAKMIAQHLTKGVKVDTEMVFESIKESVRSSLANPETVTFLYHESAEGDLIDQGILSYDLIMNGKSIRLHHSFMLSDGAVVQFVSHTKRSDSEQNLKDHISFVSSFRLVEPQIAA